MHQAPLSVEFSRQEYWSGLPFPTPGDLPDQKDNKNVSHNVMNVRMGALRCEFSDWELSQVFSATRCVAGKLGGGKDLKSYPPLPPLPQLKSALWTSLLS